MAEQTKAKDAGPPRTHGELVLALADAEGREAALRAELEGLRRELDGLARALAQARATLRAVESYARRGLDQPAARGELALILHRTLAYLEC